MWVRFPPLVQVNFPNEKPSGSEGFFSSDELAPAEALRQGVAFGTALLIAPLLLNKLQRRFYCVVQYRTTSDLEDRSSDLDYGAKTLDHEIALGAFRKTGRILECFYHIRRNARVTKYELSIQISASVLVIRQLSFPH